MANNKKRYICLIAILLAVVCCLILLGSAFSIYLFPGKFASQALLQAYTQLHERLDKSPLSIILRHIDPEGNQTMDLSVRTQAPFLGDIHYEMEVQVMPNRFWGQGTATSQEKVLNLDIYADTQYMALSSAELLNGNYYGITYDSFLQDIRTIPLLTWMIGDSVLQEWNSDIQDIKNKMEADYSLPKLPSLSEQEIQKLILEVAVVPAKVQKEEAGYQIRYSFENKYLAQLLSQHIHWGNGSTANVDATIYLQQKTLTAADFHIHSGDANCWFKMTLGEDIAADPITMELEIDNPNQSSYKIRFENQVKSDHLYEQIEIQNESQKTQLSYNWYPSNGKMDLSIANSGNFQLSLREEETGLHVQSDRLSDVYAALTNKRISQDFSGSARIQKGANIKAPQYKNIDQWSFDDFLTLIESIGSFINLDFS